MIEALEQLLTRLVRGQADTNELIERVIRQHLGDRLKTQCWGPFGGAFSLAGGASTDIVINATIPGWAGIVNAWAADAVNPGPPEDTGWSSSSTAADGIRITMLRGGSPIKGLDNINTPPGSIGRGGPDIWVPYTDAETIAVRVANAHPTDLRTGCVQVWGRWYENYQGRRG